MRSNTFKEVKYSIFIFATLLFGFVLFYLVASMFISMGYDGFEKSKAANTVTSYNTPTLIIDPGHGGIDAGATANGLVEKELNLEISTILSDYLSVFGYENVLTRNEDVLLYDPSIEGSRKKQDLNNRLFFAEKYPESCFISIHMNKFPKEYCKGLQVFYSENNLSSKALAEELQFNAGLLQTDNNRKIKNGTDTIFLLENLDIPAVLIECGFLSNFDEAEKLKDDKYKKALSLCIYCGIADFLENNE